MLATTINSTSSPAISLALARSASDCPAGTMKWSIPAWRTADTFCGSPPIGPTVPSSWIVPVTATSTPPSRSPSVSSSSSVSVNASPALGPPISPGVEGDLERQAHRPRVERERTRASARPGSSGDSISSTSTSTSPTSGRSTVMLTTSPGWCRPSAAISSSRVSHVGPVDGDDRVAVVELLGARHVLHAPLAVDLETLHVLDLHRAGDQLRLVAGEREGDVLGDLAGRAHHLQADRAPLRRRLRAELLLVGEEVDLRLVLGHPPTEHRLRRLADR